MKPKKIIFTLLAVPVLIVVMPVIFLFLYAHGPIAVLRLTPYELEFKRTIYPQWISNDEICYLELVLHRDKGFFEEGKFILFVKEDILDMYIYREKIGQPKTKKLIKHIARKNVTPNNYLGGSMDSELGFRVYANGKKLFLYYAYYGSTPDIYRYFTLDINGRHFKERIPKIIPLDISNDGKKLYGISIIDTDKYAIAECAVRNNKVKKMMDITDEKFQQTFRAHINDLKLVAKDKLVLNYTNDVNKPDRFHYVYLINISTGKVELVCDPSKAYFDDHMPYYEDYMFDPNQGSTLTKDGNFLILGNAGVYKKSANNWIKIKPFFYKEYPAVSPDGKKIAFIDILTKRGELTSLWFAGRELRAININDLLEGTDVQHE